MRSFEEEEELLRRHWEHMKDAQLEEEELEYNAADDEYGEDWDDELWEEETELWIEEEEIEKKRPKKE
ncbi:MAG: hypothetical protein Sv326_0049 [Candidatus Fermentimicrarchaeum limneticum]|uniref:Uncharacterized protein n=1 Tax=Fermentimicrarchaeum limneticum TaxID=2795018 RepID=A0A7D6BUD4_FERL1|nr:MAG: hypothetical protein Sv326_0049 [Candidatus Fermentimicrarchaeum limneticum]